MDSKRSIGIVLIVIGVTVAVHTIVEPLYHVSSEAHPYSPLWTLLDPLMGLAIVLGLIVGYPRMQLAGSAGPDAPVRLSSSSRLPWGSSRSRPRRTT